MAARLGRQDLAAGAEPPVYAVARAWLERWRAFALEGGPAPGPVANTPLLAGGDNACIVWVGASDWELLVKRHGGGPALRRQACKLFPSVAVTTTTPVGDTPKLEALLLAFAEAYDARSQILQDDLHAEVDRLRRGAGGHVSKELVPPKVAVAIEGLAHGVPRPFGSEELRKAVQGVREAGGQAHVQGLEALALLFSACEEAQIVLSCILQAVLEADRVSLELWLEHAEVMDLEAVAAGPACLVAQLRERLTEFEGRERRALEAHASAEEEPTQSLWRLSLSAYAAGDRSLLLELVAEAEAHGIDVSSARLLVEDLRGREHQAGSHGDAEEGDGWRRGKAARGGAERSQGAAAEGAAERGGQASREEPTRRSAEDSRAGAAPWWRRQEEEQRGAAASTPPGSAGGQGRAEEGEGAGAARGSRQQQPEQSTPRQGFHWSGQEEYWRKVRHDGEASAGFSQQRRPPLGLVTLDSEQALLALGLRQGQVPPLPQLKAAYRAAALRCHPDRPQNHGRRAEATVEFQRIKAAFDLLAPAASCS